MHTGTFTCKLEKKSKCCSGVTFILKCDSATRCELGGRKAAEMYAFAQL